MKVLSKAQDEYLQKIAKRAGAEIPADTLMVLIAFPIIEKLLDRIEILEQEEELR